MGLKAALSPFSTWDGYVFLKNMKDGILSKSETGLYIRAWVPEAVIAAIIAVVFPVTVPALTKVVESLLVIGGIGQRASYCGI